MAEQPQFHVVADEPRPSFFANVVAIIGFIILIVVVIWGLVHLTSLSKGWLSNLNLFNRTSAPAIAVTAPATVNSGDPFTVSWKYATTEKGNYALLYKCANGVKVKFADVAAIPCGAAYTIGQTNTAALSTTITGTTSAMVPLSVIFIPSSTSSKQVQGLANINVRLDSFVGETLPTTATQTPVKTVAAKPAAHSAPATETISAPRPATPANLAVRIIALGVINSYGQFEQRAPVNQYEIAAAQFDVSNIGGSTSGVYYFSAVLPTALPYTYSSAAQTPLAPGDHMINTLRWTQASDGGQFSVTVTGGPDADPYNNFASQWFGGAAYNQQPTYYTQQPTYNPYVQQPIYYQTQPTYYAPQYTY